MLETNLIQPLNHKENYLELFTAAEQYTFQKFLSVVSISLSVKLHHFQLLRTVIIFNKLSSCFPDSSLLSWLNKSLAKKDIAFTYTYTYKFM